MMSEDRGPGSRRRPVVLALAATAGAAVALALAGSGGLLGHQATAARPDQVTAPGGGTTTTTTSTTTTGTTGTTTAQAPPAPAGPTLRTDLPCYLENRNVLLSGSGLPAGAPYTVAVDGKALGSGKVAADGTLSGKLPSGALVPRATPLRHVVTVTAGGQTVQTFFYVTEFNAAFTPSAGNPQTLVVRFSVYGFGIGPAEPKDPTPRPLYLHYVAPTGQQIAVVPLGRTHGFCGSLPLSRPHHLFTFHPGPGTWRLQFDTSAHWSAASRPRVVRTVVVR